MMGKLCSFTIGTMELYNSPRPTLTAVQPLENAQIIEPENTAQANTTMFQCGFIVYNFKIIG